MRTNCSIRFLLPILLTILSCNCAKQPAAPPAPFDWDAVSVSFDEDQIQKDFDTSQRITLKKTLTLQTDSSGPIVEFPRFLKIRNSHIYLYDTYLGQVLVFDLDGKYRWSSSPIEQNSRELITDMDITVGHRIVLMSTNDLFFMGKTGSVVKLAYSGQGCVYMPQSVYSVNKADTLSAGRPLVTEISMKGEFVHSYGTYNFTDVETGDTKYNFRLWRNGPELYVWNGDLPEISIMNVISSDQFLVRLQHPIFIKRGMFNTDTYTGKDTTLGIFTIFTDIEVHGGRIFALIENDEIMMVAEIGRSGIITKLYTHPIASRETVLDFAVNMQRGKPSFWVVIGAPTRMNVYRYEY